MESKILEKIGFTKGEIKVYNALLELGNSTTGPIINTSQIARSKVYDVLEKLKKKGLVSEYIKANTKYFQAASPERIIDYINSKKNELKQEEENFKKILPSLVAKQKYAEEQQEVKLYVGIEGIKTLYQEVLEKMEKGDEYLAMTLSEQKWLSFKSVKFVIKNFHLKRAEKKGKARILTNDKTMIKQEFDFSDKSDYQFKYTEQVLPTGIFIFKNIVATLTWGKIPRAFVIINRENAEQYKKFFEDIWRKTK